MNQSQFDRLVETYEIGLHIVIINYNDVFSENQYQISTIWIIVSIIETELCLIIKRNFF